MDTATDSTIGSKDPRALLALLEQSGALKEGHFLLSSGRHSARFVQCALLLEDPLRARQVAGWLAAALASDRPESVLSPALGGVIIGHEVAAALGIPFRFAERREAAMEMRRGFALRPGERVAVVEDVVTTGRSTLEAAAVAEAAGAEVVAIGALIDRSNGQAPFKVPFRFLHSLELPSWAAGDCPLCAAGGRPEKPGSRTAS